MKLVREPVFGIKAVTQAVCIIHTDMASKRHKHASAFLIINTAILETDEDYKDQETGACYVNYKCKLMSMFPQRRIRIPHTRSPKGREHHFTVLRERMPVTNICQNRIIFRKITSGRRS